MKKILIIALLLIAGNQLSAQQPATGDRDRDRLQQKDRLRTEDHLMMKDGKMYQVKNGTATALTSAMTLKNGWTVAPNGNCQLANKETFQMRNGQYMDMQGNRYMNQKRFTERKMMTEKEMMQQMHQKMQQHKPAKAPPAGGQKKVNK
jgi:hypothetical protein